MIAMLFYAFALLLFAPSGMAKGFFEHWNDKSSESETSSFIRKLNSASEIRLDSGRPQSSIVLGDQLRHAQVANNVPAESVGVGTNSISYNERIEAITTLNSLRLSQGASNMMSTVSVTSYLNIEIYT